MSKLSPFKSLSVENTNQSDISIPQRQKRLQALIEEYEAKYPPAVHREVTDALKARLQALHREEILCIADHCCPVNL